MDFFSWQGIGAFLSIAGAWLYGYWMKHQVEISAMILRIQKDAEDGWTKEEKKELVTYIYSNFVKKNVPFYMRPIIKIFILPRIGKYIDKICAKSHALKKDVKLKSKEVKP